MIRARASLSLMGAWQPARSSSSPSLYSVNPAQGSEGCKPSVMASWRGFCCYRVLSRQGEVRASCTPCCTGLVLAMVMSCPVFCSLMSDVRWHKLLDALASTEAVVGVSRHLTHTPPFKSSSLRLGDHRGPDGAEGWHKSLIKLLFSRPIDPPCVFQGGCSVATRAEDFTLFVYASVFQAISRVIHRFIHKVIHTPPELYMVKR